MTKVFDFIVPPHAVVPPPERKNDRLKVYQYKEELDEKLENITAGTCHWILQHPYVRWWLETQEPSFLWMTGGPGMGKTTLSVFIIKALWDKFIKQQPPTAVAVLYSICNSHENKDISTIFSLALHQLLEQFPDLTEEVDIAEADAKVSAPKERFWTMPPETVWRIFSIVVSKTNLKRVYLVIDGLDNCDVGTDLDLIQLLKTAPPQLRVLLSSQPSERRRLKMTRTLGKQSGCKILELEAEEIAINADIDVIIGRELDDQMSEELLSAEDAEEMGMSLRNGRSGIFLPIVLFLEKMRSTPIDEMKVILATGDFSNLDDTYKELLRAIPKDGFSTTSKVLRYMLYMSRPPKVDELAFVCRSNLQDSLSSSQVEDSGNGDRLTSFKRTLKLIGPIIRLRGENDRIEFFHLSAMKYLELHAYMNEPSLRDQIICPREAHMQLAILCLDQFFASSEQAFPSHHEDFFARKCLVIMEKYVLLDYAFDHWMTHVRAALGKHSNDEQVGDSARLELIDRLGTLVSVVNDPECASFSAILASRKRGKQSLWQGALTLLQLYSLLDLPQLVQEELQSNKEDLEDEDSTEQFAMWALYCTASSGSVASFFAVYEALRSSVDITAPYWNRLLTSAAATGNEELTSFILAKRGIHPREIAEASLAAAEAEGGALGVLATRKNWEKLDAYERNALHYIAIVATDRGDLATDVIRRAIMAFKKAGASLNAVDKGGNTILHYICWSNSLCTKPLLQDLCRNGATAYQRNFVGRRPIHLASRKASHDAFEFLLDETKIGFLEDSSGTILKALNQSELSTPASGSTEQQSLVGSSSTVPGVDLVSQTENAGLLSYASNGGLTPLHWAMSRHYSSIVSDDYRVFRSLLLKGFSLTLPSRTGRTPLSIARGNGAVLHLLALVYFRLDGADNIGLSTASTIDVMISAKCADDLFNGLQVEQRLQYVIKAGGTNASASLSTSTQVFQRAVLLYLLLPRVILTDLLPCICDNDSTHEILDQIRALGSDFEWDFEDTKVVTFRQWQVLYELADLEPEYQRQAALAGSERRVEQARLKHVVQSLLLSTADEEAGLSGAALSLRRRKADMLHKTIQRLDKSLMLESWTELLWEVFQIFSLKAGQRDVAASVLHLLPASHSMMAKLGEKTIDTSTKLEVLVRLEKKLLQ